MPHTTFAERPTLTIASLADHLARCTWPRCINHRTCRRQPHPCSRLLPTCLSDRCSLSCVSWLFLSRSSQQRFPASCGLRRSYDKKSSCVRVTTVGIGCNAVVQVTGKAVVQCDICGGQNMNVEYDTLKSKSQYIRRHSLWQVGTDGAKCDHVIKTIPLMSGDGSVAISSVVVFFLGWMSRIGERRGGGRGGGVLRWRLSCRMIACGVDLCSPLLVQLVSTWARRTKWVTARWMGE